MHSPESSTFFYRGGGFTLYHAWGESGANPYRPHFHGEYLLGCQLRGFEEIQVSGKLERIVTGDLFLINPHQVHTGNANGTRDLEYISLYADRDVVEDVATQLAAPQRTPEFTVVQAADGGMFSATLVALLRSLRRSKTRELETPQPNGPRAPAHERLEQEKCVQQLVAASMERFTNLRCPQQRTTHRIGHRKIARSVEFIRDQASADAYCDVNLEHLAELAGLSKYHFVREFTRSVGMSPGAYLRGIHLNEAAKALRRTRAPVVEVALTHGFSDRSSFARAFTRTMGVTPTRYRQLGMT